MIRYVVVTDNGTFAGDSRDGLAVAGACPLCGARLIVELTVRDGDAACLRCGAIVGRAYSHARVTRSGDVVAIGKRSN